VILLPQNLGPGLDPGALRAVLLHELAHIKRGDLWINLAQTILQILYFYNPLLWLANAVIRRVREQAVDETVLVAMAEKAPQYPETLLNVAKLAFSRPALSLRLIGVVESKSQLSARIKYILNRPTPKSAKLGIVQLMAIIVTAAILLPMAKAASRQPEFIIKGTVTDAQTGRPIAGAKVGDNKEYADGKFCTVSDSNGYYEYKTWYEEHFTVCQAPGYKTEKNIILTKLFGSEKQKVLDFELNPEKSAQKPQFTATLANGVTVELIGLCEHPSQGKQWWKPDGNLLEQKPYRNLGYTMSSTSQRFFEVIFKTNVPDDDVGFCLNDRETGGLVHPLKDMPVEDIWAGCIAVPFPLFPPKVLRAKAAQKVLLPGAPHTRKIIMRLLLSHTTSKNHKPIIG